MTTRTLAAAATAVLALALPTLADACACGCGVFGVGAGNLIPLSGGGDAYVETDYMNQNRNWSGTSRAPAENNDDKQIQTEFFTVGGQYMVNRDWGVMIEVPVWNRVFRTENDAGTGVDRFEHAALGDIRLMGVYTGFSKDMSTGVTFGLKLPTGDWTYQGFDRDTSIGTGTTDALLGAYHLGAFGKSETWSWFVQGLTQIPLNQRSGYRPGTEADGAIGVSYGGLNKVTDKVTFTPILQLVASARARDSGVLADRPDSGYARLLVSPGIEAAVGKWKLYGDVEFPVYQRVNGNQLTAPVLFKAVVSRSF